MASEPTHGEILKQIEALTAKFEELASDVRDTHEIVQAWDAIKTGSRAITWLAKLAAACLGIWALIKIGAGGIVELGSNSK